MTVALLSLSLLYAVLLFMVLADVVSANDDDFRVEDKLRFAALTTALLTALFPVDFGDDPEQAPSVDYRVVQYTHFEPQTLSAFP